MRWEQMLTANAGTIYAEMTFLHHLFLLGSHQKVMSGEQIRIFVSGLVRHVRMLTGVHPVVLPMSQNESYNGVTCKASHGDTNSVCAFHQTGRCLTAAWCEITFAL